MKSLYLQHKRVRVSMGVQKRIEHTKVDLERFLSMIRFDTRQKLDDIPSFQHDF